MANYGQNGYIDFTRLWELVDKKNLNKQWLKNNGVHSNTVAKLTKKRKCNLRRHMQSLQAFGLSARADHGV